MKHTVFIVIAGLLLSACKEDSAQGPHPIEMTAEAVGFYCQMDLLNHEGPKGQIHLDGMPAPLFFSQVKDTIAYLHMPEQSHAVKGIFVQDMAGAASWAKPGPWIPVDQAIYVIGSRQMGGMGAPEFVPFSTKAAATSFIGKFGGELRKFDEITANDALSVVATTAEHDTSSDIANRLRALTPAERTN